MREFKHIITNNVARESMKDPNGNRTYLVSGLDCFLPDWMIENSKDWEEIVPFSVDNINQFANRWRPIYELNFKNITLDDKIRVWCVYPCGDGGCARTCRVEYIRGTYIYCDVRFYLGLSTDPMYQNVVAYHPDDRIIKTPFIDSDHEKIWRQAAMLSTVRQIKYK